LHRGFVHIDLPWFSHPFSFNSFKIRSAEQLAILRTLGSAISATTRTAPTSSPGAWPPRSPPWCRRPRSKTRHQRPGQQAERIARLAQRKRQVIEVEKAL
jgi:hypothetical protein